MTWAASSSSRSSSMSPQPGGKIATRRASPTRSPTPPRAKTSSPKPPAKARPKVRLADKKETSLPKDLTEVKEEVIPNTREHATGAAYKESLDKETFIVTDAGRKQLDLYIDRNLAVDSARPTMENTFRAADNLSVGGSWPTVLEPPPIFSGTDDIAEQLHLVSQEFKGLDALEMGELKAYSRIRIGLTPNGDETPKQEVVSLRNLIAAKTAQLIASNFHTLSWCDYFDQHIYPEKLPPRFLTHRRAYVSLASSVLMATGTDWHPAIHFSAVPPARFWKSRSVTDVVVGKPKFQREHLMDAPAPAWQRTFDDWFSEDKQRNSRKISISCRGWGQWDTEIHWFDPISDEKRGGDNLKGEMFNYSENANVLAQMINLVRKEEGYSAITITEDMLASTGRKSVEALMAEADPKGADPGTRRESASAEDPLSHMNNWSFALAQPGDVLLDGTKVEERTLTDMLANPNVTNTSELPHSTWEARLATGAVGQEQAIACVRCTDRKGRDQQIHISDMNTWFPLLYKLQDNVEAVPEDSFHTKNAMVHVLAMRSYVCESQANIKSCTAEYLKFEPIIKHWPLKPEQYELSDEWHALPAARQEEINGVKGRRRRVGRVYSKYSRASSVLLEGRFTTLQKFTFLAHDYDLHWLLYCRPFIFPKSLLISQLNDLLQNCSWLKWERWYNTWYLIDMRPTERGLNPKTFNILLPENGPGGKSTPETIVGTAGDAINLVRYTFGECRKEWQGTKNSPHPTDGDRFIVTLCDAFIEWWSQCRGGQMYALRCSKCRRFQQNPIQWSALRKGQDPYSCTCEGPEVEQEWSWESAQFMQYLNWRMPNYNVIAQQLLEADTKAVKAGFGVVENTFRSRMRELYPRLLQLYDIGQEADVSAGSEFETDPAYRWPQYNAPNMQVFPSAPFGTAPPILKTQVLQDEVSRTVFDGLFYAEYEKFLAEKGKISFGETFADFYKREFAVAYNHGMRLQKQLDAWHKAHPNVTGNQYIEHARSLGSPVTPSSDIHMKKIRVLCGRLVVLTTANPALTDRRLRKFITLFPKMITPIVKDYDTLWKLQVPSEIIFRGPFAWTAIGIPGFWDWWKQPSEFHGSLMACPDFINDGRQALEDTPRYRGMGLVLHSLDTAPPLFTHPKEFPANCNFAQQGTTKDEQLFAQHFYEKRRVIVAGQIERMRKEYNMILDHEKKMFARLAPEAPVQLGIEAIALLFCKDPTVTAQRIRDAPQASGDLGRDTMK